MKLFLAASYPYFRYVNNSRKLSASVLIEKNVLYILMQLPECLYSLSAMLTGQLLLLKWAAITRAQLALVQGDLQEPGTS